MEEKLLKLFKLSNQLNDNQDKIYAEIKYIANDNKILEICIRNKKDFNYIERCEIRLNNNKSTNCDNIISLFETFIGGVCNE